MKIHPVTLVFSDSGKERHFRDEDAKGSVSYLRALLVFFAGVTLVLYLMTAMAAEFAAEHGVDRLASVADYLPLALAGALVSYAALLALSYWPPVTRRLQLVVAVCFLIGVVIDAPTTAQLGQDLALAGAIGNVILVYLALRLRIVTAVIFATLATAIHIGTAAIVFDVGRGADGEMMLSFMMNSVFLLAVNAVGAFVAYHYEALTRRQFLQGELVEEKKEQLEIALRELREAQFQLIEFERQASLGRLVAGLLHEVNSPLGALISAADTIATGLDRCQELVDSPAAAALNPEKARRSIAAARRLLELQSKSAERLRELVDNLKGFVGLDAAERCALDVRRGIDSALSLLADTLGSGITIQRDEPEHPVLVNCYPGQLNQVFLRLLQNSIEVLQGRGTIRIVVELHDGRARIRIEDDGPGIPAERLDRLFEPSLIREGNRVRMNLGLPVSRRAVEKIGGELTLESSQGQGTVVTLDLPVLPREGAR